MDKETISALLGRPLTPIEDTNFDLYLEIAQENLESLICTQVDDVTETRTFDTRHDYKTAFVDIFWNVTEVKLNGKVVTDYSERQWDRRNASWYNSLVFNRFTNGHELEVTADWGFEPNSDGSSLPVDLQQVLAGLFGLISRKNKFDGTIESKRVEDFHISFRADVDLDQEFYKNYGDTLTKYSLCDIPNIQSGRVKCRC